MSLYRSTANSVFNYNAFDPSRQFPSGDEPNTVRYELVGVGEDASEGKYRYERADEIYARGLPKPTSIPPEWYVNVPSVDVPVDWNAPSVDWWSRQPTSPVIEKKEEVTTTSIPTPKPVGAVVDKKEQTPVTKATTPATGSGYGTLALVAGGFALLFLLMKK